MMYTIIMVKQLALIRATMNFELMSIYIVSKYLSSSYICIVAILIFTIKSMLYSSHIDFHNKVNVRAFNQVSIRYT